MDEKVEILIRELANKFGTTGEHLWEVMVRQASISGMTNLTAILVWFVLSAISLKFVIKQTTCPKKTPEERYPSATWEKEWAFLSWAGWGLFTIVIIIIAGCSASTIVGALFNPEYWALKQVLPL